MRRGSAPRPRRASDAGTTPAATTGPPGHLGRPRHSGPATHAPSAAPPHGQQTHVGGPGVLPKRLPVSGELTADCELQVQSSSSERQLGRSVTGPPGPREATRILADRSALQGLAMAEAGTPTWVRASSDDHELPGSGQTQDHPQTRMKGLTVLGILNSLNHCAGGPSPCPAGRPGTVLP
jgi:hypothetical protein